VHELPGPARRIALAALPFDNLSGDEQQDFFSDGLTDEMITQLSRPNADRLSAEIAEDAEQLYPLRAPRSRRLRVGSLAPCI
jgi:hypothetical protein